MNPAIKIIEIEKTPTVVDDPEAVKALANHPGWVVLMQRLKNQRALLKARLEVDSHKDLRAVDFLQSGLKWLGYLQEEVDKAVAKPGKTTAVVPSSDQLQDFHTVLSLMESV